MSNSTTSIVSHFYHSEQNLPDSSLNKKLHAAKADTTRQLILKRNPGLSRLTLPLSWAIGLLLVVSQLAQAQVIGTVFQDYDGNGIKGTYEGGVAGVTVTAYFNATVATAISTSAGAYSFPAIGANSIPSGAKARLEFGGLPTGNFSGPFSAATAGNGTSVQFVTAGAAATAINFGINLPGQYCQTIPVLYTPCFVSGQPTTGSNAGTQYSIVGVNYDGSGSVTHPALASDVGSVWGMAYQKQTKQLFSATMLKRHVGLGPLGIGGIYLTTIATSTTRQFANLQGLNGIQLASPSDLTAISGRGLPTTSTTSSVDAAAFGQVGKIGFGGLALSANQDTLWAINLYQKTLVAIHVGSNPTSTTITAADVQSYAIPDPGCNLGTYRPWAVTFHNGLLYIGVVCSAENGGAATDIKAHVYTFDPATKTFSAAPIFSITNMAYTKGAIHTGDAALGANWERWSDLWADVNIGIDISGTGTGYRAALPQPILSDITFDDDGSMVLAFEDRGGHQLGVVQQGIGTPTANRYSGYIGGDVLRAAVTGTNSYTLESNGSSGGRTGSGAGDTQGPGGGEFFAADTYPAAAPLTHTETSMGAAVIIPGRGELTNMQMDPTDVWTGGVVWMNTLNGSNVRRFEIYQTKDGTGTVTNGSGGKANGLGAISPACNLAPIEIGNRIWNDTDRDGIQDPTEAGISGVTVTLYKSNTLIATAVTNTDGEYYFSSDVTGTNTTAAIYSLTALTPGSTVQLRISQTQATLSGFSLSSADQGANDAVDSDFSPSAVGSTTAVANVTLGANGQNVHTFDAGVYVCPTITFSTPAANTQYCGNGTATFTVSTNAVIPDGIKLVAFTTETDPYSTTAGAVFSTSVASSTATGTKTLTFSNVQLPDNTSGANTGLFVYAVLVSADASCQPAASLIITLKPRPNTVIGGPTQVCTGDKATLSANAFTGATYQWFYGSGTASISTSNPYTTTAINTATTYRVRVTLNSCVSDDASFTVTPVTCTSCTASATSLGGKVYHDFDSDGATDTYDVSLSNVTVTLFRCDATNQSTQVATMQTDINGAYSFTGLTAGTTYRVEFSSLPTGYRPTYRGVNNGTTVQFTQPGSCTTSLGLNQATDYCQTNPLLVTPCYLDGAITPNTTAGTVVLVGTTYDYTSMYQLGSRTQVGSTWGVAYARTAKKLYTGSFLKRHVGLLNGKLGQIFMTDMNTSPSSASATTAVWLDVSTLPGVSGNWQFLTDATRGLGNAGTPSTDSLAFSNIGLTGLGDVDISADEKTLYVMDLVNKQVLAIDIATKSLVGKYPVPSLGQTTSSTSYFSAGAGNTTFTAADGKLWQKGYLFDLLATSLSYAQTLTNLNSFSAGTSDAALYANSAYTATTMRYSFPVGNGTFGVKLHLATNLSTSARNMTVFSEGVAVPSLTNFDTYAQAGNQINVGLTRSFTTTVTDGVLTLDFTNNTGGGFATVSGFELTTLNGTPTGETRPFALAVHNGNVYVGAINDASHSQNRDDLQASVLVLNPTTGIYNPTPALTIPLTYLKGLNYNGCGTVDLQQWHPWTSVYPNTTGNGASCGGFTFYTQPVLSDIEFDVDGSMILGFFDRFGHQAGSAANRMPDYIASGVNGRNYLTPRTAVGGDLLRAYYNGTSYELEYNGKEGADSPKPATTGQNDGEGIGGGEFYVDNNGVHEEILTGGLAFKPGSGEIRVTAGDPVIYDSGGLTGFDNTTGAKQNGFTLFTGVTNGTQDKANGLGDLEVLCDLAPIQIGNRVWRDDNKNGIQDPCEPAIPGAVVTLYDATKTTAYASVTTNAAGEYYFSSTTVTAGTSTSSVATTALVYNTSYALVITSLGTSTVVTGLSLTSVSPVTPGESGTVNTGTTKINNDAMVMSGKPTIMLTTNGAGTTNHTYDFGIAIPDCAKPEIAISKSQTICQGGSFTLPFSSSVTSNTVTGVQWYFTDATGSSFTAISGATSLTFTPTTAQQPTSTGGSRYYAIIGQNGLSATCSDTAFVQLQIDPTITLTFVTPSAATVTQCANTTLAMSVSTNAVAPSQIQLVYFTSALATATNAYTAAGGTVLATVNSTTATGTKTLTLPNVQLPDNVSDNPLTLYVYAILVSADGACKPVDQFTLVLNPRPTVVITANTVVCQGSSTTLTASGPGGTTYQWFAGSGTAVVGTSSTLATAAISTTTTYTVRGTYNTCISDNVQVTLTPVVCTSCTASSTTVGGTAFRDYNSNGAQGTNDPGLSGVTVTIFRCDANNQSVQVSQVQTDINGVYSFTGLTPGTNYRVEFSNLPAGYASTFKGTQNGSTVQFTQPGSCSISVGLNQPYDYCQTDPAFAVVCFTRNNDGSTEPTIIDMQYSTGQSFTATSTSDASYTWGAPSGGASYSVAAHNIAATKGDVSTTFGLAWDRTHKQLLTGAFMRGYAPMQTNTSANTFAEATIYKLDYTNGAAGTKSVWLDLETIYGDGFAGAYVADATYPGPEVFGKANGSPYKIGYTGLGSMQFARDGHELYAINLKTQELLVIPVNADGTAVANSAQIKRFPFPTDGCPTGSWSDGRPYQAVLGLGVHPATNRVYATVTCTGPTEADLKGIVYSIDPSDATPASTDFRRELDVPLDLNIPATNTNVSQYYGQVVHAWEVVTANSTFYVNNSGNTSQNTQPWLAEVEFDQQPNGVYGMMLVTRNRYHDIINSSFYVTGGVLMRGANLGSETTPQWALEHNGAVGPFASTVNYTYTANHAGAYTSPTNRYFKYQGLEGSALAGTSDYIPGRPDIIIPALDNVLFDATSGMTWLNRTTGDRSKDNHLLSDGTSTGYDNVNYTKSNNWGGLAIMCSVAPIQIGNRVWRDDNQNGIQDPCEPAIPGVVVTLYDAAKTTALASVTTNAAGEYYFSSTTVTTGTSTSSVATTALTTNTSYALVITSLGTSTVATGLTLTSVSPVTPGESGPTDSGTTLINNDAVVVNGKPCIALTTGGAGIVNHTYDFGLVTASCSLSLVATPGVCLPATNQYSVTGTVTLIATPASNLTITDGLVSTVISVSAGQTSATYSLSGLNSGTGLHTVTLVSSATACGTVSTTYTAPVSCTVAPVLAVVVTPGTCSTATNQYAVSGTISLTASVTGSLTITDGTSTTTVSVTAGQASASFNLAGLTSGSGSHTVTVSGAGYSPASTTYTAPVSCTIGVAFTVTPGVCQSATNQYSITGTLSLTNAIPGSATITDGAVSTIVSVSAGATSVPYSLTGLASGTGSHTVAVSYASQTNSVTYTAPLSCTVAPCGLAMIVTPGLCLSATNAYILSGTITATNIPTSGTLTISSGAFSPRTLALPAGNASGTFSYSGLVSNGQAYTVTASYSNAACSPVSQTYTAPVSCSVAPVCSLSATATAGICATATNTYSATVTVSLANAPAGTLTISVPGTTPISQTLAANTGLFTAIIDNLPSDGAIHTATISLPGCTTTTATFTAPASCSVAPICSLTATATPGLCQTATNTFTNVVVVKLTNPTTGVLTVTDGPASLTFATTGSSTSFTATFANITSNGASHTVTASLPGCSTTTTTYNAPTSCSVAPICSLTATATAGLCATATNTYSSTVVVQLTNPTAGVLTVTDGPQSATLAVTASGSATFIVEFPGLTSDGSTHTVTASLPGCSTTTTTYAAPVSCSVTPICSVSAVVTVGLCATATNAYSITAVVTVKNPTTGGTLTVSTGTQTLTFSTTANSQNTFTTTFNGLISDGASHTVTASLPGCSTTNAGYTAPVSCSIAPVCSISAVATTGQCSTATNTFSNTVAITLTNPTAGTLTVTDGVRSVTIAVPATLGTVTTQAIFNGIPSDATSHTVVASLPGCSTTITTYTAPASCTIALASLGDFVFADNNKDGIQDSGDAPIPGVTVTLVSNGTVVATTTTDASGLYSFTGLTPGVPYSVSFTTPANYTATTPLSGTDTTKDSNPINGITASVTLAPGENNPTLDAGFYRLTAGLGDYVFEDKNHNGQQDTGDTPIPGVNVSLLSSGTLVASTTTDASGLYSFTGLTPSVPYSVSFTAPTGYSATLQDVGSDVTDSDGNPTTGLTGVYSLTANEFNPTVDMGYYKPASLGDFVFADNNHNGVQDAGDTPIPGVTVTLVSNGTVVATTTTNASGLYSFTGLTPGVPYSVSFTTPANYTATTPLSGTDTTKDSNPVNGITASVTLASGENNPTIDAGFYLLTAGLGDYVFEDKNHNGQQDAGDTPIPGVNVSLISSGTLVASTTTDASGLYSFTGLTPSVPYSVSFTAPTGYSATLQDVGSDVTDSDGNPTTGLTGVYSLTANEFNPTVDMGYYKPASLGDFVFADNNHNGVQDGGDTPIPGVTVTLVSNGTVVATTTTNASGLYSFTGLTPGVPYSVSFTTPSGYTATTPLSGTDTTKDSNPVNGITASVTLASGENNPTIDAGFILPTGSIGDFVWKDNNNNGIQDTNEPGVANIKVELFTVVGGVTSTSAAQTTVTNANGYYLFSQLPLGDYTVKFSQIPTECQITGLVNAGTDDTKDSDIDSSTHFSPVVHINPLGTGIAKDNPTIDLGLQRRVYDPIGYIYCYRDGTILKGGTIKVTGPGSITITQDGSKGYYQFFTDGTPGSYTLTYSNPNAYGIATAIRPPAAPALDPTGLDGSVQDKDGGKLDGWVQVGTKANADTTALPDFSSAQNPYYLVFNVTGGDPYVSENNLPIECTPPATNLAINKLVNKSKAKIGDVLTYTVVLTNTGTTTATNVVVTDSSTTGLEYVTNSATAPAGTTFTHGTPISFWTVSSISAGQSLSLTFQAIADSSGILYNRASIPGDTATVCTSVPFVVCAGDTYLFRLTAAPGRSSYRWFRDNVEIAGQTTNILNVTAPGTYSLAIDNVTGKCPDFSCCPFIVEEDTLPTFRATAVPVTCTGSTTLANGEIVLSGFNAAYTYQYSAGPSFNEAASLSGLAKTIPANGVIVNTLSNPTTAQSYTIRVYNASGCYTDVTVMLLPTVCGCPENVCVPFVIRQTRGPRRLGNPQ